MTTRWTYGDIAVVETTTITVSYGGLSIVGRVQQPPHGNISGIVSGMVQSASLCGAVSLHGTLTPVVLMGMRQQRGVDGLVNAISGQLFGIVTSMYSSRDIMPARMSGSILGTVIGDGLIFGVVSGMRQMPGIDGSVTTAVRGQLSGVIHGVRGCIFNARLSGHMRAMRLSGSRIAGHVSGYTVELEKISRIPSTIVTIELDTCALSHGTAPCYAIGAPCYNTWHTCTYKIAYARATRRYKFCLAETPITIEGDIIRSYLTSEKYHALEILPAESMIINQRADLTFADEPDADYSIDPYRVSDSLRQSAGGSEAVSVAGTFWRRLLSRNKNYIGRRCTIRHGFDALSVTENDYVVDFDGVLSGISISPRGDVTVAVKGLLQLTDAEVPQKTDGKLFAPITHDATTLQLTPWTGVDYSKELPSSKYTTSGLIKIDKEIIAYTNLSLDQGSGITTITGLTRGGYNAYGWDMPRGHDAGAAVQQARFIAGNPLDIMVSLVTDAGIPMDNIDSDAFSMIREEHFPAAYFCAVLAEPAKIKTLLQELREQTLVHIYQDATQRVTAKYVAPNKPWDTYRQITDEANIVFRSTTLASNDDKRITRATVHYDQAAGQKLEAENFWRVTEYRDANAESVVENGEVKSNKPIYSRWLWSRHGGDEYSRWLASIIVERYRDGSPSIVFDVELKDSDLALGEIFDLTTEQITDYRGYPLSRRFMTTKRERASKGKYRYTAVDTTLNYRYLLIAPDDFPATWNTATTDQQAFGCVSDDDGRAPDYGTGYKII